ncbi:uncharacterized protein LOC135685585 isoform X2 [Rhopilema esculentum]|uniref:uncharacterized protein LOC135685585 isoform X2 n=1 Tax=Rhopilema esculentum TaxID=499914 RepID=UPI0031D0DA6B
MDQQQTTVNMRSTSFLPQIKQVFTVYQNDRLMQSLSLDSQSHQRQSPRNNILHSALYEKSQTIFRQQIQPGPTSTGPMSGNTLLPSRHSPLNLQARGRHARLAQSRNKMNATGNEVLYDKHDRFVLKDSPVIDGLLRKGCFEEAELVPPSNINKHPSTKDAICRPVDVNTTSSANGLVLNAEIEAKGLQSQSCSLPSVLHKQVMKVIFRESFEQKYLQANLDANFSGALADFEIGRRCGDEFSATRYRPEELLFTWKEIELVLQQNVEESCNTSLLTDLIDIGYLQELWTRINTFSSNSAPCNTFDTRDATTTAKGNCSVSNVLSSTCVLKQNQSHPTDYLHAKNVTSIPCDLKHMTSKLGSSNAFSSENIDAWDNAKLDFDELTSSMRKAYNKERAECGKNGVYLGRYPCLRDVSVVHDQLPSMCDGASPLRDTGNSPDIIIRPRPYTPVDADDDSYTKSKQEISLSDQETYNRKIESPLNVNELECKTNIDLSPSTEALASVSSNQNIEQWSISSNSNDKVCAYATETVNNVLDANGQTSGFISDEIFTRESSRKGLKNKPRTQPNHCLHLWEFLLDLLNNDEYSPKYIAWTRKDVGEFKLIRTEFIANLWGQSKKRKKMTYEKMARALRELQYITFYGYTIASTISPSSLHFGRHHVLYC